MAWPKSHKQLSALNNISKELKEHVATRPVRLPSFEKGIQGLRSARAAHLHSLHHLLPIPGPIPESVEEKDVFVPVTDDPDPKICVRVYAPTNLEQTSRRPIIVLYHEGGWMFGDLTDEEMNARLFARDLGAICLNVEYRLAPENRFPTGINDCWRVLQTAYRSPEMFHKRADPTKGLIIGGSSAGGNISAVLAHKARKEGVKVTGQWLSCPYIIPASVLPAKYRDGFVSMAENNDDPVIGPMPPERESGMYSD
jgi:acetyl esterase/lipase